MGALHSIDISALGWLGKVSIQAALLVCIILLVQVIFKRYLPGRWRYALWLLLMVRLIIPWAPASRFSVFNLVTRATGARDQASSYYQPRIHQNPLQMPSWLSDNTTVEGPLVADTLEQAGNEVGEASESQLVTPVPTANTRLFRKTPSSALERAIFSPDNDGEAGDVGSIVDAAGSCQVENGPLEARSGFLTEPKTATWNWQLWLLCIWLTGVLVLLVGSMRASLQLWWIVKRRRPVTDSHVLGLLEDCKEQMGVQTLIGLVESDQIKSPALFGFLRPRLLVPHGLLQKLSRNELRHVFLHELAHLKRYDVLLGWITLLLQAIHWFNPLVWLAFYRMRTDREIACDQEVLKHVSERELTCYGNTILVLLNHFSRRQYLPSLVGILEHKTQAERRIKMIATFKKETPVVSVWALGLIVVLGSVALTNAIPQATDVTNTTIAGQPDPGLYQFIFSCTTQSGTGSAKGLIDCQVAEDGVTLKNGGSHTSNTPMIPLGTIAMYHLRHPSLMVQFPLKTGSEWTDHWTGYDSTTRLFLERAPVVLDAGTFSNCLLLETTIKEAATPNPDHSRFLVNSTCGTRYIWLAPGVGLVRMIYEHKDGTTTQMVLTDYTIGAETKEYLPMVHDAIWHYLFKSDAHRFGIEETWRLNDTRKAGRLTYNEVTTEENSDPPLPRKRSGESETAYRARLRMWLNSQSTPIPELPKVTRREGESEAAYQARSRAAQAAALRAMQMIMNPNSTDETEHNLEPPKKRDGESTAAHQARMRAYQAALRRQTSHREKADKATYSRRDVILTKNGENGQFKAFSKSETRAGKHLAIGRFMFNVSEDTLYSTLRGTVGTCPEPLPYYTVWAYICHGEKKLLELPVTPGSTWSQAGDKGASTETAIEGYETMTVKAGTFGRCAKHVTIIKGAQAGSDKANAFANGVRTLWFAPGVGLVKMVYEPENGKTTHAELLRYTLSQYTGDYLPLALGNEWTYCWSNDYRNYDVIETVRIPKSGDVVKLFIEDGKTSGPDWREPDRDRNRNDLYQY